tara:strand:+ start:9523 stop:10269 length:747 start_codon:yes stop_codon:yes gene_type:complete
MNNFIEDLFSLKGKVAIVTGGSKGIGRQISEALARAGAEVYAIGRSKESKTKPKGVIYCSCDITKKNTFKSLCKKIIKEKGKIDILFNSAGISLESNNENMQEIFRTTIETNLIATFNCCQVVSELMLESGVIVNVSSIGSKVGFPGNPGYVSSKGGIKQLTKALAIDYSKKNIRVNSLVPGYMKTDMTKKSYENPKEKKERLNNMIIKRWGKPQDLIGAAIFLCSDASSYMTGAELIIDGGWLSKGL